MREIKFRAWDKEQSKFYYFGLGDETANFYDESNQYTGSKDKNGVEIYEGDVLGGLYGLVVRWCDKCKSIELFDPYDTECCYQCNGDLFWYDVASDDDLEVIGNIYENPELIKENN